MERQPVLRVAIDLGAGSGRAFIGAIGTIDTIGVDRSTGTDHTVGADGAPDAAPDAEGLLLEEVHRFHYGPRMDGGHLRWDAALLFEGLRVSLQRAQARAAALGARLDSVGVDSWAVDYALLDADERLLEDPICYRDERTAGVMDDVLARVPREELFARTGIQFLPLNTIYQLAAHVRDGLDAQARRLLLIPDLCHHFLCGSLTGERTNASTTQLLDVRTGTWDRTLFERLGLPHAIMPDLVEAGTVLGHLRPSLQAVLDDSAPHPPHPSPLPTGRGGRRLRVIAPASHDTASAVVGAPLEAGWAFISSGTWSLVGVERDAPLLDPAAARANFTNEAGAFGTVRFLTNVMGLWLLESCRKAWAAAGDRTDLPTLLARVAAVPGFVGFVDPDAPRFFNPASMTRELQAALADTGQPAPDDAVLLAKVVLDSLAARYATVIASVERLTRHPVRGIHIVGGGSLNAYLNQATADATNRPVVAGPVEATAVGNLIVQAIASGELPSLTAARARVRKSLPLSRYEPRQAAAWREGLRRYGRIEGLGAGG